MPEERRNKAKKGKEGRPCMSKFEQKRPRIRKGLNAEMEIHMSMACRPLGNKKFQKEAERQAGTTRIACIVEAAIFLIAGTVKATGGQHHAISLFQS